MSLYGSLELLTSWFQRSIFPLQDMKANESLCAANLEPKGMVGRIYVGDHLTLLNIK